jgi:uncharacterized protein
MEPRVTIITLGVADLERSYRFYHEGLGFPTSGQPQDGVIFFQTGGTCLALYPYHMLAEDVAPGFPQDKARFPGITLAHNTRTREEMDEVLELALRAGAKLEKPISPTPWGAFSAYFSDPDGYLWEVYWSDTQVIREDGSLVVD